jgi:hypothetical protein
MSYATARSRLIEIIEQEVLVTDMRLFADRFKHAPNGASGLQLPSRSFWLEANVDGEGGITGPYTPTLSGQPRSTITLGLSVFYRAQPTRAAAFDEVLESDRVAISVALLNPALWSSSTSRIHNLAFDPPYLRTRRVASPDASGVVMRMVFPLWHS